MQEQAADFGCAFQVSRQVQYVSAERPVEFNTMLRQRADAVTVEWPFLPHTAENLACAPHLASLGILQDENIQVVIHYIFGAAETGC